jgi:hypothetical protein
MGGEADNACKTHHPTPPPQGGREKDIESCCLAYSSPTTSFSSGARAATR